MRLPDTRSFVVVADAEELIGRPALLKAYAEQFGPDDDATLVLAAPELVLLPDAFSQAAASVGLDDASMPDVLALELGSLGEMSPEVAQGADAVLSAAPPNGAASRLPWIDADATARLHDIAAFRRDCESLRARLPERFGMPLGYVGNDDPVYFDDTGRGSAAIVHQPHVYEAAAEIARRTGATGIVDVGCGAADKLLALAGEFSLIGIDYGVNLEHCRRRHPEHSWIAWDIEHEPVPELPDGCVVVCADVIEHIIDPTGLLLGLARLAERAHAVLISTPDRERVRGAHDLGPSPNLAHVREWTLEELVGLLEAAGLAPAFAGHTLNNDRYRLKRTSLAIIDGRHGRPQAAPEDFVLWPELHCDLRPPWSGVSLHDAVHHVARCGYDAIQITTFDGPPLLVGGDRVFPYAFDAAPDRDSGDFLVERLTGVGLADAPNTIQTRTRPRVVMTLLVRDEADIVAANLDFHLAQGVDFVIATDHLSGDGTTEILEGYERMGVLHLIREETPAYDQEQWVTAMARLASDEYAADWVLNVDADEFWWSPHGDLAVTLATVPETADKVIAWRYNFAARPDTGEPFLDRMRWRASRSVTWEGIHMGPKVCHRASPAVEIPMGNHNAHGLPGAYADRTGIEVLHFPWRSRDQVRGKAVNGTNAIEQRPELDAGVVCHWRDLADRHRRGVIDEAWAEICVDDTRLAQQLRAGTLVTDDRLRQAIDRLPTRDSAMTAG